LSRSQAATGSRFSTSAGAQQAGLQEDIANQRGMFLANLFQQGESNKLAASQGLAGIINQEKVTEAGLANQLQQQAAIERQLKDQKARDELTEFKRSRSEELQRIGLLQTEANRAPFTGIKGIPDPESGMSDLIYGVLNAAVSIYGGSGDSFKKSGSSSGGSGSFGGGNTFASNQSTGQAATNAGYGSSFTSLFR